MSKVRISAEWCFGDIVNYFKLFESHKKVLVSVVGRMYIVCVLLQNAQSRIYGSVTSEYFGLQPVNVENTISRHIVNINISSSSSSSSSSSLSSSLTLT